MIETHYLTLYDGRDIRIEVDGQEGTIWGYADPAPLTDRAAWVEIGDFILPIVDSGSVE